ncbi:MAG: hypothetical protein GX921_09520 [Bacteroidales bacterium]|nr:hypothetical protein [Bacteroidales bacterium]
MKKFILAVFTATIFFGVNAQKADYDPVNAPYGHGQDSVKCLTSLSLMSTAAKAENYKDAVKPWEAAYKNCPASSRNIYIYGPRIFKALHAEATDEAKKKEYLDLIMEMYDARLKYFSNVDSKGTVLCYKANDYKELVGDDVDHSFVYKILDEAIKDMGSELRPSASYYDYIISSLYLFLGDNTKKDQFIDDYFRTLDYIDGAINNAESENDSENANYLASLKESIETVFVNSGAGDCNTLQEFYSAKFEDNKDDEDFLNKAIGALSKIGCNESDFYFDLSATLHKLTPSANSAIGLANRSLQNKDYESAMTYYEEAARLEDDTDKASGYMMTLSQIMFSQRRYSQARQAAYEALEFKPNNGDAYILIAKMYASSAQGIFSESEKRGLVFSAAVDKLQRAKSVDPGVSSEANKLISQYSGYYMEKEDAFMMGLSAGESVFVPGWIGETTTIRTK